MPAAGNGLPAVPTSWGWNTVVRAGPERRAGGGPGGIRRQTLGEPVPAPGFHPSIGGDGMNEGNPVSSPHPAALRARAMQLVLEGCPAREVARQLGVSPQTVYRWRRSAASGSNLAQARTRIDELEGELLLCREVIATMRQMMPPKDGTR
ncbi:helix-turn-helix domain-containing protein [Streptomyces bungoensis]|uniref:helix-turn-helix domain-containing protein n=1 Tax=Streptomyces bungoensis TaxID=285568 RepID=UPI00099EC44A